MTLDDDVFAQAKAQLTDKYGAGQHTDDRKDEQCVYGNGANFKVNSGAVATHWVQKFADMQQVETSAVELVEDSCPPRLDGPALLAYTLRYILIEQSHVNTTPKPQIF